MNVNFLKKKLNRRLLMAGKNTFQIWHSDSPATHISVLKKRQASRIKAVIHVMYSYGRLLNFDQVLRP